MAGAGCMYFEPGRMTPASISSTPLATEPAPTPVALVRQARLHLVLEWKQKQQLAESAARVEEGYAAIDRSRGEFLELLARGVEQGAFDWPKVDAAAARVIDRVDMELPGIERALLDLHACLRPEQRAHLVDLVVALAGAQPKESPYESAQGSPGWLNAFRRDALPADAFAPLRRDTQAGVERWTAGIERTVEAWLPRTDAQGRSELALRLRTRTLRID